VIWYGSAFANWNSGGWFMPLLAIWNSGGWFMTLFAICHLGLHLWMIWEILFTLLGKVRLRITQSEITRSLEILGLRCLPSLTAARQNIVKVELTRLSYKYISDGDSVAIPPQINIWAGTKKFTLGGDGGYSFTLYTLTAPELDWLAQELSNWLNLPITKER
jgi:hypothetical protein